MIRTLCLTMLAAPFLTLPAHAADCTALAGQWTNAENGEPTLTITEPDAETGQIGGSFISPSGTAGETFAITGWVVESAPDRADDIAPALTFSVRFGPYGSVSAWSGTCRLVDGTPTIETIWHLTRAYADYDWAHQLTGTDVFVPVE